MTHSSMSWPRTRVRLLSLLTISFTLLSTCVKSTFSVCCKSTIFTRPRETEAIHETQQHSTVWLLGDNAYVICK